MSVAGYSVRKAAQVAAFFAIKAGGSVNVLKLTKLIYLADREFLNRYDVPILFDKMVSMPHGPVNSITYDYMKGGSESPDWDAFILDKGSHEVGVKANITLDSLDMLSQAVIEVLENVWSNFSSMKPFEIRDYTHEKCIEWEDPDGSSNPIPYERIFKALGKQNIAAMLSEAIEDERRMKEAWE